MEGTQPSAAGGDGAPTAMVAVPGLSGALTQAFPLLGGSGTVSMEASLRLRAKDYAAHDRWLVNLQDVITSNRLDDLWENQQVPTLEAVQRQFAQETSAKQQELYATAMKQWQLEASPPALHAQHLGRAATGRCQEQEEGCFDRRVRQRVRKRDAPARATGGAIAKRPLSYAGRHAAPARS